MVTELGVKVKILRKNNGVKQESLAKVLGISKGQMCNLENGKRNFSLGQLQKICDYFNIDLSYFFYSCQMTLFHDTRCFYTNSMLLQFLHL